MLSFQDIHYEEKAVALVLSFQDIHSEKKGGDPSVVFPRHSL